MRPDLNWIQDQLAAAGLSFGSCRDDSVGFDTQCPVHKGEGRSARFAVRNGVLLFTCYAYGCDFKAMKDALDLTDGDCYAEHILRDRKREIRSKNHISDLQAFCMVAENDMAQGKRLTASEQAKYRDCLIRLHGAR